MIARSVHVGSVSRRRTATKVFSIVCTEWLFTVDHWKVDTTRPASEWEQWTSTQQEHFYRRRYLTVRQWCLNNNSSNSSPTTSHVNVCVTRDTVNKEMMMKIAGLRSVTLQLGRCTGRTSTERKLICCSTSAFCEQQGRIQRLVQQPLSPNFCQFLYWTSTALVLRFHHWRFDVLRGRVHNMKHWCHCLLWTANIRKWSHRLI